MSKDVGQEATDQSKSEEALVETVKAGKTKKNKAMLKKEAAAARMAAKQQAEESARARAEEAIRRELYDGTVKLRIARPVTGYRIKEFERDLAQESAFRIASVGGSIDEGAFIVLFVDQPAPLLGILSEKPDIECLSKGDKDITITLKSGWPVRVGSN